MNSDNKKHVSFSNTNEFFEGYYFEDDGYEFADDNSLKKIQKPKVMIPSPPNFVINVCTHPTKKERVHKI